MPVGLDTSEGALLSPKARTYWQRSCIVSLWSGGHSHIETGRVLESVLMADGEGLRGSIGGKIIVLSNGG